MMRPVTNWVLLHKSSCVFASLVPEMGWSGADEELQEGLALTWELSERLPAFKPHHKKGCGHPSFCTACSLQPWALGPWNFDAMRLLLPLVLSLGKSVYCTILRYYC